jgi:hypothetical protein
MSTEFWKALFRPGRRSGPTLDYARAWEVSSPPRPIRLASALRVLLSEEGIVALEGTSIHPQVKQTLQPHLIVAAFEIRPGTLYPRPEWLHMRASEVALNALNELVNSCAGPEICNHLYAYEDSTLLLEWHDAFSDPIHVAGTVSPKVIAAFCAALGVGPAKPPAQRSA